jgi:hypothetical protein
MNPKDVDESWVRVWGQRVLPDDCIKWEYEASIIKLIYKMQI